MKHLGFKKIELVGNTLNGLVVFYYGLSMSLDFAF